MKTTPKLTVEKMKETVERIQSEGGIKYQDIKPAINQEDMAKRAYRKLKRKINIAQGR